MSNVDVVMSMVDVGDGAKADQLLKAFPSLKTEKTWYS